MTVFPTAIAASFLLLFVPTTVAAEETFGCHSWEIFEGSREGTAFGVSTDDGATYTSDGTLYVVNDGTFPFRSDLFSIWIYQESNGIPGLQRSDEVCDETNGEYPGDVFCIC